MQVEQRNIADIEPYGKNAKKHPEKQVNKIADSIREFGFNQPIVVDKEGVIIVGHGRYLAASLLGIDTVPIVELDISEEKAKAYRLADNKLNESEWDMELVVAELKGLSLESVDLTGFSRKLVLNSNDRDDDVPAIPKVARSKAGDVYELGAHRLECGDSTNTTILDFHKSDEELEKWAKQQKAAEAEGRTTIWTMKRTPVQDYVHPTQKPVELIMYALHNSSKVDDIVLDPFLGSGSTLIACEKTNRHCYGAELDLKYCDVIIQRWVDFTGNREITKNGEPLLW